MTTMLRRFRKDDPENCLEWACGGRPIVAVDPGAHGALGLFQISALWRASFESPLAWFPLRGHDGAVDAARGVKRLLGGSDAIALVESSFAGGRGNSLSDLVLARNAGIVVGALLASVGPGFLRVVMVPPTSWQKVLGLKGRVKRPERKAAALEFAEAAFNGDPRWSSMPGNMRDPLADAMGMAAWWASLERPRVVEIKRSDRGHGTRA